MIGFIIWLVGLILTVMAASEIWNLKTDVAKRLLAIILIVITSWFGLAFYYFYARNKMADWLK